MPVEHPAYLVAGLGFGDEGKGQTTDALVRHTGSDLVIRYNGGAQCAHNVVSPEGKHHTFAQFGSGTFVPGVRTYLSRFVLVNPVSMMIEEQELRRVGVYDGFDRMFVDCQAVVITPYQRALNRLQEIARNKGRHGSTGMGIGVAREHQLEHGDKVLLVGDLPNKKITKEKLEWSRYLCMKAAHKLVYDYTPAAQREIGLLHGSHTTPWYLDRYAEFCQQARIVSEPPLQYTGLVFEGAQGMLLDEEHGFQPHTTWTDITYKNAETIMKEMGYVGNSCPVHRVGVLRTYYTRHGAGPFPSENNELLGYVKDQELHNKPEEYTGDFRVGLFDIPLMLYALDCISGVDSLAINHVDVAVKLGAVPVRLTPDKSESWEVDYFLNKIQDLAETPLSIIGHGQSYNFRDFFPAIEAIRPCQN